ncbi:uncharacterized protein DNG_01232 [Cephalotrichum gorgonifer]|uniref:AN1-type domain-containing protein n=1 Tax=Cephalotrichum gorgonifer TaxID=2041049 RepID=A0AAE8MRI0_9PEZI|nr:uncharacterized protein DNG_01232 [Cephalotrichum gorgonifer]
MAPKRNPCTFKDCQLGAQRIVGDCGFCQGHFCSKHRLLEDHKCEGLEDVGSPELLSTSYESSASSSSSSSSSVAPPSAARAAPSAGGPQWWLVGLCDTLASDDMDMADIVSNSARSSRTSGTPHSSRASAPRSLRVFDENYDDCDDDDYDGDSAPESAGADTPMGGM